MVKNPDNSELVAKGADRVIDNTKEDYRDTKNTYDAILDPAAYESASKALPSLVRRETYVLIGGSTTSFIKSFMFVKVMSIRSRHTIKCLETKPNKEDFLLLSICLSGRKLIPHIDRINSLNNVPEAITKMESRDSTRKIVISVE